MGLITKFHTFSDGYIPTGLITADRLNTNWDRLYTLVNGELEQENIASGLWLVATVTTKPTWDMGYEGKIIYARDTHAVSIATDSGWVDMLHSAHASDHKAAGSDPLRLDELKAPTDVTTLNATSALHGLLPKLSNVSTEYLNGVGSWVNPKIDDLTQGDDNTDLDSSTSRHGLLKKLDNDSAHFMNGTGAWSTPTAAVFRTVADASSPYNTISNNTERSTTSLSNVKIKEIKLNEAFTGSVTISWDFQGDDVGETVYSRLYLNGVAQGTGWETTTNSKDNSDPYATVDKTLTASFAVNDLIQIYGYCDTTNTVYVANMKIKYNWQIYSIDGQILATALEVTTVDAVSTTNQDP